jgi:hypothetical protein
MVVAMRDRVHAKFVLIALIFAIEGCSYDSNYQDISIENSSDSSDSSLQGCKPSDTITEYWSVQYIPQDNFKYGVKVQSDKVDLMIRSDFDCSFPTNVIPTYYWSDSNNLCLRSFCGLNCFNDEIINSSNGEIQTIRNAIGYSEDKDFVIYVDEVDLNKIILKSIHGLQQDKYYNLDTPIDCQTKIECIDSVYEGTNKFTIYQGHEVLEIKF